MRGRALLVLGFCLAASLWAEDWEPVPETLLSVTKPRIDPDADAEAIFRKIWISDEIGGTRTVKEQYLRIKIYTQRGVEQQSTVDLVSSIGGLHVDGLRARTIKPDGRIIELQDSSIFERTAVRARGVRLKVKAFSMPGVEPGDIIEYRWQEIRDSLFERDTRLYLETEIPSWSVTFNIKQSGYANQFLGSSLKSQTFNMPHGNFEWGPGGFYTATWENVAAFKDEPRMPPENHVRASILFFYSREPTANPEKFWIERGKFTYKWMKDEIKINRAIKKKAAALTAGIAAPEEKVNKIREFCLNEIKNVYHDRFGMTADDRRDVKENNKPSDTLKRETGSGHEINMLFAALVNAIGVDARIAECAGRDRSFFNPKMMDPYVLNRALIAARLEEEWKFYDLSNPYLEEEMLAWEEEGVLCLISDPDEPVFVGTPYSGPERNRAVRIAALKLQTDGSIEGKVEETFLGHLGVERKTAHDGQTDEERLKDLEEAVRARFGAAEISNVRFENVTDMKKPYKVRYDIKATNYAERTGKRLFLRPAHFRRNVPPEFPTSERKYSIYFQYSWSSRDEVLIQLPEGYELENAESPSSHEIPDMYRYKVKLGITPERQLLYTRDFVFGEKGNIIYPADIYSDLKKIFDFVHEMDNHVVTLRDTSGND